MYYRETCLKRAIRTDFLEPVCEGNSKACAWREQTEHLESRDYLDCKSGSRMPFFFFKWEKIESRAVGSLRLKGCMKRSLQEEKSSSHSNGRSRNRVLCKASREKRSLDLFQETPILNFRYRNIENDAFAVLHQVCGIFSPQGYSCLTYTGTWKWGVAFIRRMGWWHGLWWLEAVWRALWQWIGKENGLHLNKMLRRVWSDNFILRG